jgi:hypothetical protein
LNPTQPPGPARQVPVLAIARVDRQGQPDYRRAYPSDSIHMPNHTRPSPHIQRGDTVAYKRSYLDRQTLNRDKLVSARGKVTALHRIAEGVLLADVAWDTAGISKRVYVNDLVKA